MQLHETLRAEVQRMAEVVVQLHETLRVEVQRMAEVVVAIPVVVVQLLKVDWGVMLLFLSKFSLVSHQLLEAVVVAAQQRGVVVEEGRRGQELRLRLWLWLASPPAVVVEVEWILCFY